MGDSSNDDDINKLDTMAAAPELYTGVRLRLARGEGPTIIHLNNDYGPYYEHLEEPLLAEEKIPSRYSAADKVAWGLVLAGTLLYVASLRSILGGMDFDSAPTIMAKTELYVPEAVEVLDSGPFPDGTSTDQEADLRRLFARDGFDDHIHQYVFVNFCSSDFSGCRRLSSTWEALAERVANKRVKLVTVNCLHHRDVCRSQNVTSYPTLSWFGGDADKAAEFVGCDTLETLLQLASIPAEKEPTTSAVVDLTESNFEDFLKENDMVFVDFFAPWCVWSQRAAPMWEMFALQVQAQKLALGVGRVDCVAQANLCCGQKITFYSNYRWFENGQAVKDVRKLYGNRTVDGFMEWVDPMVKYAQRKIQAQHKPGGN